MSDPLCDGPDRTEMKTADPLVYRRRKRPDFTLSAAGTESRRDHGDHADEVFKGTGTG